MNSLQVTGKQNFMGKDIPVVLGGFGEDKKCLSDKTIAEIHGIEAKHVRERISQNIKRFNENIDFTNLKQRVGEIGTLDLLSNLGYAKQSITQAEHIYILSERGYAKLIKIMDSDLAWEIHDKLIDEYFGYREKVKNKVISINQTLSATNTAVKIITKTLESAGVAPQYIAVAVKNAYQPVGIDIPLTGITLDHKFYDATTIAEKIGIMSKNNKPHAQAVTAIILDLNINDLEKQIVPFERNGHSGTTYQYSDSVINKIIGWLKKHNYPVSISSEGKNYSVRYKEVA